jgi:hypothetical protein
MSREPHVAPADNAWPESTTDHRLLIMRWIAPALTALLAAAAVLCVSLVAAVAALI